MIKQYANVIIIAGIILIIFGVILKFTSIFNQIGKLPGDILIKKENFTFYMPITSMIIISVVVSLIIKFLRK